MNNPFGPGGWENLRVYLYMPLFILRVFWDNWLARKALDSGKPVIDASRAVMAIH